MIAAATPMARRFRFVRAQQAFRQSHARRNVTVAGRRSGKTEIAMARLGVRAATFYQFRVGPGNFIVAAPTRDQAKRIHWERLKALFPSNLVMSVGESELCVTLMDGTRVSVIGMDRPERAEGVFIDGALLDEYADMKEDAWKLSIRPALSTPGRPPGWCDFIGKPRGRNHFWKLYQKALAGGAGWGAFHWSSEEVIDAAEIASLREDLDEQAYDQEVRANFVNFQGRAYYAYFTEVHAAHQLGYDPHRALDLSLDFNVEPGTAGISQEQDWPTTLEMPARTVAGKLVTPFVRGRYTAIIDEVWQPRDSNVRMVVDEIVTRWRPRHKGTVRLFGDPTGNNRGAAKLDGPEWQVVRRELAARCPNWKVVPMYAKGTSPERCRIEATNRRLMATSGHVRVMVDPVRCPHHALDYEAVTVKPDGSLDKKADAMLTHCSDGVGYKFERLFPEAPERVTVTQA